MFAIVNISAFFQKCERKHNVQVHLLKLYRMLIVCNMQGNSGDTVA